MSIQELTTKIKDYRELKRMAEDLAAELDALAGEIKDVMGDQEQITVGEYKVTHKTVTSQHVDATAFKAQLPDVAARFIKTTTTRRFVVS